MLKANKIDFKIDWNRYWLKYDSKLKQNRIIMQ